MSICMFWLEFLPKESEAKEHLFYKPPKQNREIQAETLNYRDGAENRMVFLYYFEE